MSSVELFHQFVAAINDRDSVALKNLMTPDHLFIDSLGNQVQGAERMQSGWRGYFQMCPDYRVEIDTALSEPLLVIATGHAAGTIDGVSWRTPAAWKAVMRDGLVSEWQVFADNKPVYEILAKRQQ